MLIGKTKRQKSNDFFDILPPKLAPVKNGVFLQFEERSTFLIQDPCDSLKQINDTLSEKQHAVFSVYNKGYISEEYYDEEMRRLENEATEQRQQVDENAKNVLEKFGINLSKEFIELNNIIVGIDVMNSMPSISASDKTFDFLLYVSAFLMSPKDREASLGDMEEKYHISRQKFGAKRANRLMARDVAASTVPFVKSLIRGASLSTLKAFGLYKILKLMVEKLSGF